MSPVHVRPVGEPAQTVRVHARNDAQFHRVQNIRQPRVGGVAGNKVVDQPHGISVIGDPEIRADFFPLDIPRVYAQDDLGTVFELLETYQGQLSQLRR